jgi:hypothetical protein
MMPALHPMQLAAMQYAQMQQMGVPVPMPMQAVPMPMPLGAFDQGYGGSESSGAGAGGSGGPGSGPGVGGGLQRIKSRQRGVLQGGGGLQRAESRGKKVAIADGAGLGDGAVGGSGGKSKLSMYSSGATSGSEPHTTEDDEQDEDDLGLSDEFVSGEEDALGMGCREEEKSDYGEFDDGDDMDGTDPADATAFYRTRSHQQQQAQQQQQQRLAYSPYNTTQAAAAAAAAYATWTQASAKQQQQQQVALEAAMAHHNACNPGEQSALNASKDKIAWWVSLLAGIAASILLLGCEGRSIGQVVGALSAIPAALGLLSSSGGDISNLALVPTDGVTSTLLANGTVVNATLASSSSTGGAGIGALSSWSTATLDSLSSSLHSAVPALHHLRWSVVLSVVLFFVTLHSFLRLKKEKSRQKKRQKEAKAKAAAEKARGAGAAAGSPNLAAQQAVWKEQSNLLAKELATVTRLTSVLAGSVLVFVASALYAWRSA